jgi:hypothetical protein
MSMGPSGNGIAAAAGLVKVEIFAAGVPCNGNMVAAGSQPLSSLSFTQGQPIALDVPPGMHTVALTAWSDPAGTMLIGAGCQQDVNFQPGQAVCVDLSISAVDLNVPDANDDLSVCRGLDCPCMIDRDCVNPTQPRCGPGGLCVACVPQNDNCPFDQFCDNTNHCALGCKSNAECVALQQAVDGGAGNPDAGTAMATNFCDTTRHDCVECLSATDCTLGKLCSPSGACVDGCDLSLGKGCKAPFTCCNKFCVDTSSDPLNCNQCGTACTGATNTCCSGTCTNKANDTLNCGGCGTQCSTTHGSPACTLGQCSWTCGGGYAHCVSGNTGCETPTNSITNCGGCGNACDTTHSLGPSCNGATCLYTGCVAGWGDCSTVVPNTNGCETNLSMAGQKVCSNMCVPSGSCCVNGDCTTLPAPALCYQTGSGVCSGIGGSCSYSLKTGSKVCSGNVCCMPINGTCNANCTMVCSAGWADCDGDPSNGCETHTDVDANNCGSCGSVCDTTHSTGASCSAAKCSYTGCAGGYADCNTAAPDLNGCETNLASTMQKVCSGVCVSTSTCCANGDCTSPVPAACYVAGSGVCSGIGGSCSYTLNTGSKVCTGNVCCNAVNGTCNTNCTLICNAGFADCDGNPSNGCETNTTNDVNNCGACGRFCAANNVATKTCTAGLCNSTCLVGFGNCTQPAAGSTAPYTPDDGCETNINTSTTHCGGCGTDCTASVKNATQVCNTGTCSYSSCNAGFYDCNGNKLDGCEAPGQGSLGCCNGTTEAATGTPMNRYISIPAKQSPTNSIVYYYDCLGAGTPGNSSTYSAKMSQDASAAAVGLIPGPQPLTCSFQAWTSTGTLFYMQQLSTCNQSSTQCACWSYSFSCTNSTGTATVACPAGITENSLICTKCPTCTPAVNKFTDCGAVSSTNFNWQTFPTGYVDVQLGANTCYCPSTTFNDPGWGTP